MVNTDLGVSWVGGLLVVVVSGIFNAKSAALLRRVMLKATGERPAVKALVDFRRAVLLMTPEQMAEFTAASLKQPVEVAVGVLMDTSQRALGMQHCSAMVRKGHTRVLFTELSAALEWVGGPVPQLRPMPDFQPRQPAQ